MELQTDAAPLHVSCDEKFDFNLESKVASFVLNVKASRETAPGETDSMQFKFLDLLLDDGEVPDDDGKPGLGGDAPSVVPAVRSNSGTATVTESDRKKDRDVSLAFAPFQRRAADLAARTAGRSSQVAVRRSQQRKARRCPSSA